MVRYGHGWSVPPRIMGMGPAPATQKVLALTGLTLAQLDVIELNEAFAAQGLAVLRELDLSDDDERVNAWGGAIALGHPLGASGARLVTTAVNRLHATGGRYALCTMCIGVGRASRSSSSGSEAMDKVLGTPEALRATARQPRCGPRVVRWMPSALALVNQLIGPAPLEGHARDQLIEHLHRINDHAQRPA